jgi:hypothetical protein
VFFWAACVPSQKILRLLWNSFVSRPARVAKQCSTSLRKLFLATEISSGLFLRDWALLKKEILVRARSVESEVKNTRSRSRAAAVENRILLKAHCQGRSEHLVDKLQNPISLCTHPQSWTLSSDALIFTFTWLGGCVCREHWRNQFFSFFCFHVQRGGYELF